jgi:hypothetical protein
MSRVADAAPSWRSSVSVREMPAEPHVAVAHAAAVTVGFGVVSVHGDYVAVRASRYRLRVSPQPQREVYGALHDCLRVLLHVRTLLAVPSLAVAVLALGNRSITHSGTVVKRAGVKSVKR